MIKVKKKKNPNDSTFRNINALKKQVERIIRHLDIIDKTLDLLIKRK